MVVGTSALKFCDWEISVSRRMWKCGGWREEGKVIGEMNRNRASSSRALEETRGFLWRTGEEMLSRECTVRSNALRDREHFICLSTGLTAHKCFRKVYWAVLFGRQDRTTDDFSTLEYSKWRGRKGRCQASSCLWAFALWALAPGHSWLGWNFRKFLATIQSKMPLPHQLGSCVPPVPRMLPGTRRSVNIC